MNERRRRLLPRSRRAWLAIAAGLALALGALALAGYLYERNRTGSIYHPHARFVPQPTPTLPKAGPDRFSWPLYGYTKNHTRFFPAPASVVPPFRTLWVHNSHALLEFPPVMYGDHIFQLADNGVLYAIDKHTGHIFWQRSLGTLSASTPAVNSKTVYATVLSSGSSSSPGRVWALNYATGQTRWVRNLPARASPRRCSTAITLFFGSQSGRVYALDARDGNRAVDLPGAGAPSRPARRSRAACSTSATTPATCRRSPSGPAGHVGLELRRSAARQRHLLLHRRRHLRPRVPRQHRRPRLCLRRRHRQARLGRPDRRLRLRLPRRHERPRPRPDDLRRLLRRDLLRLQRPHVARSAGSSPPMGASRAPPRSSGGSCTSPTSANTAPTASGSPPVASFSGPTPAPSTPSSATARTST